MNGSSSWNFDEWKKHSVEMHVWPAMRCCIVLRAHVSRFRPVAVDHSRGAEDDGDVFISFLQTTQTMEELSTVLNPLPKDSNVAVLTLLGSFCPATLAHIQAFTEAREFLFGGRYDKHPHLLESFAAVLGFISANPDGYVSGKFQRTKGEKKAPLNYEQRIKLIELATANHSWIQIEEREGCTMQYLKHKWRNLKFTHITMNGADDVVKNRKWKRAGPDNILLTLGRPGDTEKVVAAVKEYNIDPRYFILGPELPNVSSTAAREALAEEDVEAAKQFLHPSVADWCIKCQCWQ